MSTELNWSVLQSRSARIYFALIFFTVIGVAHYYYFYKVEGEALPKGFYSSFDLKEMEITPDDISHILLGGTGSDFHTTAVNAAFLRYRIDQNDTGMFDRFLLEYQKGYWDVPKPEVWKELFVKHTQPWQKVRAEFKNSGALTPQAAILPQNKTLLVGFKNTSTPMIGTVIEVVAKLPDTMSIDSPVYYLWELNGETPTLPRATNWKVDKYSTGTLGVLSLNLGLEPQWFITGKNLKTVEIQSPDISAWDVLDIRYR